jgi:hypothetical protein
LSDIPEPYNPNAPAGIKLRSAAALIRQMQRLAPVLDEARLTLQELTDVVEVYGALTDEELQQLGVSAAQVTSLATFLTKFFEFMDASTQTRKSYRSAINTIRRAAAEF